MKKAIIVAAAASLSMTSVAAAQATARQAPAQQEVARAAKNVEGNELFLAGVPFLLLAAGLAIVIGIAIAVSDEEESVSD